MTETRVDRNAGWAAVNRLAPALAVVAAVAAAGAAEAQTGRENYDPRLPRAIVDMPEAEPNAPLDAPPSARAAMPTPARPAEAASAPAPDAQPEGAATAPAPAGSPQGQGGFDLGSAVASPALPVPETEAVAEDAERSAMPAWQRYARPFEDPAGRPRIAVVVSDLGLSQSLTAAAIARLPAAATLAISPHAADPAAVLAAARGDGHEVLAAVPMEPLRYPHSDPGPDTLLTSLGPQQNLSRLGRLLGGREGYVGVLATMGARFTASPEALRPVLRRLDDAGLMFVEREAVERSVARRIGGEVGLPYAEGDRALDGDLPPRTVELHLLELEHVARNRGQAVAVVEPSPMMLERLGDWIATLPDKGLVLAPISAVATVVEPGRRADAGRGP